MTALLTPAWCAKETLRRLSNADESIRSVRIYPYPDQSLPADRRSHNDASFATEPMSVPSIQFDYSDVFGRWVDLASRRVFRGTVLVNGLDIVCEEIKLRVDIYLVERTPLAHA